MIVGLQTSRSRAAILVVVILLSAAHNVLLLALPIYSLQVMGRVLPSGDVYTLCSMTVLLCLAVAADWAVERSRGAAIARLASEAILDIQYEVSRRSEHLVDNTGLFEQACNLKARLTGPLGLAVLDAPWASIFLLALFYLKVELGFAALIILAGTFAVGAFSSLSQKSRAKSVRFDDVDVDVDMQAGTPNYSTSSGSMDGRFLETAARTLVAADENYERSRNVISTSQAIRIFGQAGLIAATAMLVARGELAVGSILATSMLFARAISPIDRCSDVVSISESVSLLSDVLRCRKRLLAAPIRVRPNLPPLTGSLVLAGVSVRHPIKSAFVLKDVTCTLVPGRLTVLAGQSGSGKSTLLAVLAGHIRPDLGDIHVDGFSLADIDLDHRNRLTGSIGVRPISVRGSFAQIIAGDKILLLRSVMEAADLVGLHGFIGGLPEGYRTILSVDDATLSRGQQQQLWLARCFYGSPKLLLLDEPTAFLDEESTETLVMALKLARRNGANIIVASRCPEIVALHDEVICLAPGRFIGLLHREEIENYAQQ